MDSKTIFPSKPIITLLPTTPQNISCDIECKYTFVVDNLSSLLLFDNITKTLLYRKQLPQLARDIFVSPKGDYVFIISEQNMTNKCFVYKVIQPLKLIEIDEINDIKSIAFLSDCSSSPIDIVGISNDRKTIRRYY